MTPTPGTPPRTYRGNDADDDAGAAFTVTNPPGTVTVTTFMDGRVQQIDLSPKATTMTETDLADEIVVIAGLATQDARSAQYAFMLEGMREQGHDDAATRDFLTRDLDLPSPEQADGRRRRTSSRPDMQVTMTEHLASALRQRGRHAAQLPGAVAGDVHRDHRRGRNRLRRLGRTDPLRRHRPGDACSGRGTRATTSGSWPAPPRSR